MALLRIPPIWLVSKLAVANMLGQQEDAMDYTTSPVTSRIVWCRRQRAKACTEAELEAWRAEEEGLRDAVLHRDHVNKYRHGPPSILERYVLGFQDAKALIRAARATRFAQSASHRTYSHNQFQPGSRLHYPTSRMDSCGSLTKVPGADLGADAMSHHSLEIVLMA